VQRRGQGRPALASQRSNCPSGRAWAGLEEEVGVEGEEEEEVVVQLGGSCGGLEEHIPLGWRLVGGRELTALGLGELSSPLLHLSSPPLHLHPPGLHL